MAHNVEYGLQQNDNLTDADIDRMKAAGAKRMRINIDLAFVYPTSGDFSGDTPDYTAIGYDQIVYAHSIGLKVLGQLAFVPGWMRINGGIYPSSPPNDYGDWSTMCARAYRDLKTYVTEWEIWNEANLSQFWVEPGTWTYPSLLSQAVAAMRYEAVALGGAWSDPFIISSGLASTGSGSKNWTDRWDHGYNPANSPADNVSIGAALDKLFDEIVPGKTVNTIYVDGYGLHSYTWGNGPNGVLDPYYENPLRHAFEKTGTIGGVAVGTTPFAFWDDIICAHEGYSDPVNPPQGHKRLWATENGWPGSEGQSGYSYTAKGNEQQTSAAWDTVGTYWEIFSHRGAGPMHFFPLRDKGTGDGDEIELYGGLLRLDNSAKAIRNTFKTHADNYQPDSNPAGVRDWDSAITVWDDPTVTWDGGIVDSGPPDPTPTTLPNVKVEIGIYPRPDSGPWIVLGDPIRGKLTSSTYVLAPEFIYYDIGNNVEGIDASQGRLQEGGRTEPGSLSVTAWNNDRRFDKRNAQGPYYPYLKPPKMRLRLWIDGVLWISTVCNKLSASYIENGTSKVDISGNDNLSKLARTDISWVAKQQTSKTRINRILDHAGYTGPRAIDNGVYVLGRGEVSGNALDLLSDIAQVEDTLLYCAGDGTIVFLDRAKLFAAPVITFDDGHSAGSVPFKSVTYVDGYDLLKTSVTVTRRAHDDKDTPEPQTFADQHAVNEYGDINLEITDSPVADDNYAAVQAAVVGTRLSHPTDRIDSVTLDLADFPLETRLVLCILDMGKACRVIHRPPGGGSPAATDQMSVVTGRRLTVSDGTPTKVLVTYYLHAMDGGI